MRMGANLGLREQAERENRAAEMPHRQHAGDCRLDARLESELGRLFFNGHIGRQAYEAGVRYGLVVLQYLQSTDAPTPYGDGFEDIPDENCLRRKIAMAAVGHVLRPLGRQCRMVVDRVCVYDEPIRGDHEMAQLRVALSALAGE